MSRTAMTIRARPAPNSTTPLDVAAMDDFDQPNGMTVPATGDIGLVISNPTVGAITLTVHSTSDPSFHRTGDITAYSIAAGHVIVLQEFRPEGWAQAGTNLVNIDASATGLTYLAIQRASGT